MRIALIGYGKMGKEIEKIALERGHEIVARISSSAIANVNASNFPAADAAIEFTQPEAAVSNIKMCFEAGIPVVVGTTGWYKSVEEIKQLCISSGNSMIYASNFSLGVNILFDLNRRLAQIMNKRTGYDVSIEEIHHVKKLDAPSGTAISLANDIVMNVDRIGKWQLAENAPTVENDKSNLMIHSIREGEVTGMHTVRYTSLNDLIELRHEALNRKGFAEGAVIAAEWIAGKKGFFTMNDVLNLNS